MQVTQFTFGTNEKIPPAGATFIANGPEGKGMLKVTVCAILNISWTPAKSRLLKRKNGAVAGITVDMMAEVEPYEAEQQETTTEDLDPCTVCTRPEEGLAFCHLKERQCTEAEKNKRGRVAPK